MPGRIVILQGSESDTGYTDRIVNALRDSPADCRVVRRIASAHRTPDHAQRVLDQYNDDVPTVVITTAGLSDALTGTVAARFPYVVAAPPDAETFGDAKRFSSTRLPGGGGRVEYATVPEHAAGYAIGMLQAYDPAEAARVRNTVKQKAGATMRADAAMQGAEFPQPHTFWKSGKTRDIYDLGDGTLQIVATDRVSAYDAVMPERIPGKGEALTDLAEFWFQLTETVFPNHFIERLDDRSIRVKKANRIDVEAIIRGYIYGSLFKAYAKGERNMYGIELPDGLRLAEKFPQPLFTPTTKAEEGHDLPITKEQALQLGLVRDEGEWDELEFATRELYQKYAAQADDTGLIIPDFKIEFGRVNGQLIQIDEPPNHDSARIWKEEGYRVGERQEGHAWDKEFLRAFLDTQGYTGDGPAPHLPAVVVDQIARRVRGASDLFLGRAGADGDFGLLSVDEVVEQLSRPAA